MTRFGAALRAIGLGALVACASSRPPTAPSPPPPAPTFADAPMSTGVPPTTSSGAPLITGWLRTEGNQILLPNGKRFHGRGANVHDTRSCDACAWEPPRVDEVKRRIDTLVDGWHATFVRLLLESYPDAGGGKGRTHFRDVLDDDAYFRDVMQIVGHVGKKPGVYVLVSLWHDPSLDGHGWPTERTKAVWKKLATALRDMPFVMFGVVNEPQHNDDGKLDAEVWRRMKETVDAIRSVERPEHPHLVAVQGTREWARVLDYYVDHPIGPNVVYETHVYDGRARFAALVERPAQRLPVIIGEHGIVDGQNGAHMNAADCVALMDLAEKLEVPWLAYTFHHNCPPNLLVEHKGTCGAGVDLAPSPWGALVKERLARPY